ncbi:MAG: LbtU family siderophore porin [Thermodesulfobacteriota bacterium]|nr:LbtU family siderophore porin [Thermodesulfobacteriota bacterium]
MQQIYRTGAFIFIFCLSAALTAQASDPVTQRIDRLENELTRLKSSVAQEKKEDRKWISNIMDRVSISGLVEVEGFYTSDYEDEDESDFELATAELGIDAQIHDFVSSHVLFLWEEGEGEDICVDEAFITIGNTEKFPIFMTLGRQYVPFGVFETRMVSDPLTLEIAETQETSVLFGFEYSGVYGGIYLFNGDIDEESGDDHLENFGANIGYSFETGDLGLDFSASYISSLGDTDGVSDALPDDIEDYVDGISFSGVLGFKGFTLIGEYVTALDEFEPREMVFKQSGAEPEAWNLELGYNFDAAGHDTTLAVACQGTDEALALELPETRYMAVAGMGFFDNLIFVSLEYAYDEDYDESDGGSGEEAHTLTTQIAMEF